MNIPKKKRCPVTVGMTIEGAAKVVYCGQWSCKRCARLLARKWAKRTKLHIEAENAENGLQIYIFITLTLPGKVKTPERGFALLPKLWDRLRTIMRRKVGATWHYIAFVEGQPERDNMPHFHIISSQPLPIKPNKHGNVTKHMIHDFAVKIGFGHQVDHKPISSGKAASYVSKYASKQSPITPKGFRRVRASQKWRKLPKDPTKALLVQSRDESFYDFVHRCAIATNQAESEVYMKLIEARQKASEENDDNDS